MKRRILIDMDEILVDLMTKWLKVYNEEHSDTLTREDIVDFNIHKYAKAGEEIYRIIERPGFFDDLKPLPGAVEGFKALRNSGHHVMVASSPAGADSARAKYEWCEKHLDIARRDITLTHRKAWFAGPGHVIIDDKPRTLTEWTEAGGDAYTISYPYNKGVSVKLRADDYRDTARAWSEIVKALT